MVMLLMISVLTFASVGLISYAMSPEVAERGMRHVSSKAHWASGQLSDMFVDVPRRKLMLAIGASPLAGIVIGLLLFPGMGKMGALIGGAVGIVLPQIVVKVMGKQRQSRFQRQLVDCLMVLSSSLKAGLSMLQAIEVAVQEMPPPASQEFGLVLKENKMGVPLNDAVEHLKKRMPSEDLVLIVTAVLVARETGGDVTEVFTKLIETIRERQKFKERIKTLTVIPRVQAIIMACLPIVFAIFSYQMSPAYFQPFFRDEFGQMLLMVAVGTWFASLALMVFFGKIKV